MVFEVEKRIDKRESNDTSRGEYETVKDVVPRRRSSFLQKIIELGPLSALPFIAAGVMLAHHFFYTYLNGKSIDHVAAELPSLLQNQNNVNFIGTTIAHAARIVLSMAIYAVFAQLFWETLRSRGHTIQQIDALVNCGQSPFRRTALRAATTSLFLFSISVVASATALLVVLTPGSLTVSTAIERQYHCTVPSVPQGVMESNFTFDHWQVLLASATYILTLNSYLPPFQAAPSSTCRYATCFYNVSFPGPALSCVDITNLTDFSSFLAPIAGPAPFTVWNADYSDNFVSIFSRDLLQGKVQATNCTINSATFDTVVTLAENTSSVEVRNITPNTDNFTDSSFFSTFSLAALSMLGTKLIAGSNGYITSAFTDPSANLQINPFFVTTSTGNHTFSDSPAHFAETFIRNVSLSLLSGNINYGLSSDTATNLERMNTTCSSMVAGYIYDPSRLLSTYGTLLGIGAVVVTYGCWLISRNGREKKLIFSDVIQIALNDEMISLFGKLGQNEVQLSSTGHALGTLLPLLVSSAEGAPDELSALKIETKANHSPILPTMLRNRLSAFPWKMLLLILAALSCMALNHAYYHYLDGKEPISAVHSSGWLRDQTILSDIGIALAYASQTFLALAIATSCTQLFWRSIRSRGHTISQIDALTEIQAVSFPRSMFRAFRASWVVTLLSLLAASTTLVSIFAPGSIKVLPDRSHPQTCTVLAPRNLSELQTTFADYGSPITAGIVSGTYLQPASLCPGSQCSYNLEFVGPGFDCLDVTKSSNYSTFNASYSRFLGTGIYAALYFVEFWNQTDDSTMRITVQTWDMKRSVYQAVNCTGVSRSYSVSIFSGTASLNNITVTGSRVLEAIPIPTNSSQSQTFSGAYLQNMMTLLAQQSVFCGSGPTDLEFATFYTGGGFTGSTPYPISTGSGIARLELDGSLSMAENLTLALEEFAQNSTLSLLSDTVFAFNSDDPNLLENITTTCTSQSTAYEYLPYRLFLTYGVAIFVAILCAIWGTIAVKRNEVEESMNFSRILQAVLNEKMYNARENLDKDTVIKADDTEKGSLEPLDLD